VLGLRAVNTAFDHSKLKLALKPYTPVSLIIRLSSVKGKVCGLNACLNIANVKLLRDLNTMGLLSFRVIERLAIPFTSNNLSTIFFSKHI